MPRPIGLLLASLGVAVASCGTASARDSSPWLRVVRDSGYDIALDTSRISGSFYTRYAIWYRTDHAEMRFYQRTAFNREIVHALLNCNTMSFKIVSVAMSVGSHRPVIRQEDDVHDLRIQDWRRAEPGTMDGSVARAACEFARRRASPR